MFSTYNFIEIDIYFQFIFVSLTDLKQEIQVREKCRHTTENDKLRLVDSNKMEMCEKEGSGDIALSCSQSPSALQPPLKSKTINSKSRSLSLALSCIGMRLHGNKSGRSKPSKK